MQDDEAVVIYKQKAMGCYKRRCEMERTPHRKKCEIEGSPYKGEDIIEVNQLVDDFGMMGAGKRGLCQHYQDCHARKIKCEYTKMVDTE